ncbi:MAG: glycosyltransferase family 39 protein [Chloroflexota bacterium]
MRRHLLILVVLTVLVRGWMMISYPMSGTDDNQAAQRYLIDQVLSGNLLIGNLRYQTGYPFVIAPVFAVARLFGQFDDRIILLVQVALSATIPFMIYDILRRRRTSREALIVALFLLLDPFGLQWAHFYLPEWLIAFCMILGLWLIEQGLRRNRALLWTGIAGIVLGFAAVARFNFAPVVAILGVMLFLLRSVTWRKRLLMFTTLGVTSAFMLILYMVLIQHPSMGTWEFSCISGINMLEGIADKGIAFKPENGTATAQFLDYESRYSAHEIEWTSDTYPKWRFDTPFASPAELDAFNNNSVRQGVSITNTNLIYFLGPCAADSLMHGVFFESVRAEPLRYLLGTLNVAAKEIVQLPTQDDPRYFPMPDQLTPTESRNILGFERVKGWEYTGEWVWLPGVELFSTLFSVWNLYKWLTPLALIWTALRGDWFYRTAAVILVAGAIITALVEAPEARIYSWMYPLAPILIGGMVAALLRRWERA